MTPGWVYQLAGPTSGCPCLLHQSRTGRRTLSAITVIQLFGVADRRLLRVRVALPGGIALLASSSADGKWAGDTHSSTVMPFCSVMLTSFRKICFGPSSVVISEDRLMMRTRSLLADVDAVARSIGMSCATKRYGDR